MRQKIAARNLEILRDRRVRVDPASPSKVSANLELKWECLSDSTGEVQLESDCSEEDTVLKYHNIYDSVPENVCHENPLARIRTRREEIPLVALSLKKKGPRVTISPTSMQFKNQLGFSATRSDRCSPDLTFPSTLLEKEMIIADLQAELETLRTEHLERQSSSCCIRSAETQTDVLSLKPSQNEGTALLPRKPWIQLTNIRGEDLLISSSTPMVTSIRQDSKPANGDPTRFVHKQDAAHSTSSVTWWGPEHSQIYKRIRPYCSSPKHQSITKDSTFDRSCSLDNTLPSKPSAKTQIRSTRSNHATISDEMSWQLLFDSNVALYDSDIFFYATYKWRLLLCRNKDSSFGFSVALLNGRDNQIQSVNCEFKLSRGVQKEPYTREATLSFKSSINPSYQGFKNFMGSELLSYVRGGVLYLSIKMSSSLNEDGLLEFTC